MYFYRWDVEEVEEKLCRYVIWDGHDAPEGPICLFLET